MFWSYCSTYFLNMKLFPHLTLKPDGYLCFFFSMQKQKQKSSKNFNKVLKNKQLIQSLYSFPWDNL